jgi:hypothetical protein
MENYFAGKVGDHHHSVEDFERKHELDVQALWTALTTFPPLFEELSRWQYDFNERRVGVLHSQNPLPLYASDTYDALAMSREELEVLGSTAHMNTLLVMYERCMSWFDGIIPLFYYSQPLQDKRQRYYIAPASTTIDSPAPNESRLIMRIPNRIVWVELLRILEEHMLFRHSMIYFVELNPMMWMLLPLLRSTEAKIVMLSSLPDICEEWESIWTYMMNQLEALQFFVTPASSFIPKDCVHMTNVEEDVYSSMHVIMNNTIVDDVDENSRGPDIIVVYMSLLSKKIRNRWTEAIPFHTLTGMDKVHTPIEYLLILDETCVQMPNQLYVHYRYLVKEGDELHIEFKKEGTKTRRIVVEWEYTKIEDVCEVAIPTHQKKSFAETSARKKEQATIRKKFAHGYPIDQGGSLYRLTSRMIIAHPYLAIYRENPQRQQQQKQSRRDSEMNKKIDNEVGSTRLDQNRSMDDVATRSIHRLSKTIYSSKLIGLLHQYMEASSK